MLYKKTNLKNIKNSILILCLLIIILTIPTIVNAQIDPGGDPDAPIDGGLGILLLAGIGYGVKKLRDNKKAQSNNIQE